MKHITAATETNMAKRGDDYDGFVIGFIMIVTVALTIWLS